jgi:hypothetical protein
VRPFVIAPVFTLAALGVVVWAFLQHRSFHDYRLNHCVQGIPFD